MFVFDLGFGEGENEFLLRCGKNERGKGGVVEDDGDDGVDEKGEPAFGFEGCGFEVLVSSYMTGI